MTTTDDIVDLGDYQEDLEVDFSNEDQTGFIWAWLDTARDQSQIVPGAVLTLRDGEDLAMGQVVDLVPVDEGVIVHLQLLPGAVEDYHAAIERSKPRSARATSLAVRDGLEGARTVRDRPRVKC